ncbi:MurR/RpiR family transcriptional regulator [Fundicoccus culcitae]|uniref:MurR/RpiR family transcriptional regulator n=1 Tax=Fundicoccus culcitae TaxID=2969821 RepID=A0ABY5PA16_9LACT|nr:MurR/RpiR family transcriptional regulator [Fundicoccus culcitae]UUX35203.1 MurR/RpiR family transcriptional regulator [Fundicoccus culcitae]
MLIIEKIKHHVNLTDVEYEIGKLIITLGYDVSDKTTRWIAKNSFTSPTSVVRFCQKLGFSGFDEFKEQYVYELNYIDKQYGKVNVNFPFMKDDSDVAIIDKLTSLYKETIDDTKSLIKYSDIEKVKKILVASESIYIFSAGTALNQAQVFKEKMMKIGKRVIITTNLNYQLYEANSMAKDDVAIIVSYSGETKTSLLIAEICKSKKIPIIAITSIGENSLKKLSYASLQLTSKENIKNNIADYSTHLSVSFIFDVLYSVIFRIDYDNNYNYKQNYIDLLESQRTSTNEVLWDENIQSDETL